MPRPPLPADDLYARLEVPPDATSEAIEIAWRALLKRHHPDIAGAAALELAKRINVAHDWLSDPELRARYDEERGTGRRRAAAGPFRSPTARRATARPAPAARPRRPADPAAALRRFVERVGRLTRDELDRLSVADTTSIAFVASIHRFLTDAQVQALEAAEGEIRTRLAPPDWADPAIRDAILAAAHELILAPFLDEHLAEPFRGRARDRLLRGWEAAIDQPRYGPNTTAVGRFVERAGALDDAALATLVRVGGRGRLGDDPWPRGLDPAEDETLRVSSVLAGRDAVGAAADAIHRLPAADRARAERLLGRTAHALVLRHAFGADEFSRLVAPWVAATGDPGTGRRDDTRAEPRVRRR
jgi:curved DNA-binding protein CbpA